jgi:hypothetical protein
MSVRPVAVRLCYGDIAVEACVHGAMAVMRDRDGRSVGLLADL